MKTKMWIVLLLLSVFLWGCGKSRQEVTIERENCVESRYFNARTDVVEGKNGYYVYRSGERYLAYISKQDLTSEIFLCSKPDCQHISTENDRTYGEFYKDCNAWLGAGVSHSIKYYEGSLYMLMREGNEAVLYRISEDGSRREKLFSVGRMSEDMSSIYPYIVDGNSVYVLYIGEGFEKDEFREISRFSLEDGHKEVIFRGNEYYLDTLMMYGNSLYFRKTNWDGDNSIISRYNSHTGEIEDLVKDSISFYTIDDKGNSLLYWRLGEGLIRHDIATGEEKMLRKSDDTMLNAWLACNGKYVVLDGAVNYYFDPEKKPPKLEFVDLEQEKVVASMERFDIDSDYDLFYCGEDHLIATFFWNRIAYIDLQDISEGKEATWKYVDADPVLRYE